VLFVKIGVDVSPVMINRAGIGNYVLGLLHPLIRARPQDHFILDSYGWAPECDELARYPNVEMVVAPRWSARSAFLRRAAMVVPRLQRVDVLWATAQSIPRGRNAGKVVVTQYDFNFMIHPETTEERTLKRLQRDFTRIRDRADAVVAISHGTAKRMEHYYGRQADAVVCPVVRPLFRPMELGPLRQFLKQHGLEHRNYALTVGTLEPRKNLDRLIASYVVALERYGAAACIPLVLVGGFGWKNEKIMQLIQDVAARFPGQIVLKKSSDEELVGYLSGARAMFYVSRMEGYGMPIAEARACGTPVVCSDLPEMREAAQEDGVFIPLDELESRLPPLFLKKGPEMTVRPASYPTPEELAQKMGQVFDR
jgi:glycosyltransferase involved in cell wall biosynthesis